MKILCWFLPHKWEENLTFAAKSGPMNNGVLAFYKCARCGKLKLDFKAKVSFEDTDLMNNSFEVSHNSGEFSSASPSLTRQLVEAADVKKHHKEIHDNDNSHQAKTNKSPRRKSSKETI